MLYSSISAPAKLVLTRKQALIVLFPCSCQLCVILVWNNTETLANKKQVLHAHNQTALTFCLLSGD